MSSRYLDSLGSGRRWPRLEKLRRDSAASTASCARLRAYASESLAMNSTAAQGPRPRDQTRLLGEPLREALLHLLMTCHAA